MKKIAFTALLILITFSIFSQRQKQDIKWFSIALKAGVGNSLLINSDIFSDNNISPNMFTLGYSYGGKFTFSYGNFHHFGIDFTASSFGQEYDILASGTSYTKTVDMTSFDIIPTYKYMGEQGGYVEIGAKFSSFKSIDATNDGAVAARYEGDLMPYYEPKFSSAVFGFGITQQLHERVHLSGGLRFAYSLTDVIPDRNFNVVDDMVYTPDYTVTTSTNPFSAQVVLELNYFFAFYGNASCGRGRLMFFQ